MSQLEQNSILIYQNPLPELNAMQQCFAAPLIVPYATPAWISWPKYFAVKSWSWGEKLIWIAWVCVFREDGSNCNLFFYICSSQCWSMQDSKICSYFHEVNHSLVLHKQLLPFIPANILWTLSFPLISMCSHQTDHRGQVQPVISKQYSLINVMQPEHRRFKPSEPYFAATKHWYQIKAFLTCAITEGN